MILVTGASGFIGQSLTNQLTIRERRFKNYAGRLNNPTELQSELTDVLTVLHLASSERQGSDRSLQHVDIEGTERLIESCHRKGVKRIVYLSRLGADLNALHPLLRAKGIVEQQIKSSGLDYTILRSATAYGRSDHFLNRIATLCARSWPFILLPAGGKAVFQPIWVEDLALCLALSMEHPKFINQTIELGGEEMLRYQDIVAELLPVINIHAYLYLNTPLQIIRPLARLFYGWHRHPLITRFFLDQFSHSETVHPDSILRHFGFRPTKMNQQLGYLRKSTWRWRMTRI